jgi:hypothetical protein
MKRGAGEGGHIRAINPTSINAARRPLKPTCHTFNNIIPMSTGTVVISAGTQNFPNRSAVIPAISALTIFIAETTVGSVLTWMTEYRSGNDFR